MKPTLASQNRQLVLRNSNDLPIVNLAGRNNPFGTIAQSSTPLSTSMGFIPLGAEGQTLDLLNSTNVGPNWLGLNTKSMQWWAYNYCSPLAAVIDRLAEANTNGRLQVIDTYTGIQVKNLNKIPSVSRVMKLLKRPNPLQTWQEFNSQQEVLLKIFGYCPVFAVGPSGMDKTYTKMLWNLNPFYMTPQFDYEFDMMDTETKGPIRSWFFTLFGKSYTIPAEDIMLLKDGFVDNTLPNLGLPLSKVAGLDYSISNICAAMEADNVLLKKKGPLGIFSYDQRPDMAGQMPMNPADKDELQKDLERYGMTWGQLQYVISKASLKWNAMSFNLRDLMTKETARAGTDNICDRFGFPAELMSGKNATYENRHSAAQFLYENNIIPYSLRKMERYDEFFGFNDLMQYSLNMNYNHLNVIQEDILKAGQAKYNLSEGLTLDWENGMITRDQYLIECEYDPIGGAEGNMYYPDYIKAHPEMNKNKPKELSNANPAPKDTSVTK